MRIRRNDVLFVTCLAPYMAEQALAMPVLSLSLGSEHPWTSLCPHGNRDLVLHHCPPLEPRVSCIECPAGVATGNQLVHQDSTYLVAWSLWVSMCFCPLTDSHLSSHHRVGPMGLPPATEPSMLIGGMQNGQVAGALGKQMLWGARLEQESGGW